MPLDRRRSLRIALGAALAPALLPARAPAQTPSPPSPPSSPEASLPPTLDELVRLDLTEDPARRLRAPVRVNGRGPFPFMVDTGADTSVVSVELAAALGLESAGFARVNGIAGSRVAPRAHVAELQVGGRSVRRVKAPLLAREHMGALGIIGLDCLHDQRVDIDFRRNRMAVRPSKKEPADPGAIVVYGKTRFGRLILVDSTVRREPVYVVLDTGAQDTIGNAALHALLNRRRRARLVDPAVAVELASATGQTVGGRLDRMEELTLGGVRVVGVPVVYADLHTFRVYKLVDEPALMLGMNTLRSFRGLNIDFGRREVAFDLPEDAFGIG